MSDFDTNNHRPYPKMIHPSWHPHLVDYFKSEDYAKICDRIFQDEKDGNVVFPPVDQRFRAFEKTSFDNIRCVIVGQDPYHQADQANGLAFSVKRGKALPPSLRNIFKELRSNYPNNTIQALLNDGDLECWSSQGVLLINALLSVREGSPLSHQDCGWEPLIEIVMKAISQHRQHVAFVLWGKSAQHYKRFINPKAHLIIEGVHPSPLSAHRGFFGSQPFVRVNEYLRFHGRPEIFW
jgi:uracil-DNA glycosylase